MRAPLVLALLCFSVTAQPIRTVDGDTFTASVSIWLQLEATETVRVLGVDTPEMQGTTRAKAEEAKAFTSQWLGTAPVTIFACKRDSFGRVLGVVTRGSESLAEALISGGYGVRR